MTREKAYDNFVRGKIYSLADKEPNDHQDENAFKVVLVFVRSKESIVALGDISIDTLD